MQALYKLNISMWSVLLFLKVRDLWIRWQFLDQAAEKRKHRVENQEAKIQPESKRPPEMCQGHKSGVTDRRRRAHVARLETTVMI